MVVGFAVVNKSLVGGLYEFLCRYHMFFERWWSKELPTVILIPM